MLEFFHGIGILVYFVISKGSFRLTFFTDCIEIKIVERNSEKI